MDNRDFGKKLIEARKQMGLTQKEVADKCNITERTIQRIEAGDVNPRSYTIKTISEALGINFFASNPVKTTENRTFQAKVNFKIPFQLKKKNMKTAAILSTSFLLIVVVLIITSQKPGTTPTVNHQEYSEIAEQNIENYSRTKDRIEVAFTNDFTYDSLLFIQTDLWAAGIELEYKKLEFDENEKLQAIDCFVDCNDGYKGGFAVDNLNSSNKSQRFGFVRDYSAASKFSFRSGVL